MWWGTSLFLKGDEISPNSESDEQGVDGKDWITTVTHDPEDRQADGRWKGTIIQKKVPVREIKWEGLYDKNSDKLYAPKQELFERCVSKYRKLLDDAKEGIK